MSDINYSEYCVKDIQIVLKKLMDEFIRICNSNSIQYYLVKGGLIGAIKYKDFIPWDPDIDFALPLSELQRFCSIARKELKKPYKLFFYDEDPFYEYLFPRIGLDGIDYRQLHLDIFLLTFCPNDAHDQKKYINRISRIELFNTFRNSNIKRPINSIFNRMALIISRLFLFWIPKDFIRKKHIEVASIYNNTDFYIQIGAVDEYGEKYIMPYKWFGQGVLRKFNSLVVRTPSESDSYLERMYPSFMTSLPPERDINRQKNRKWLLNKLIISEILDE